MATQSDTHDSTVTRRKCTTQPTQNSIKKTADRRANCPFSTKIGQRRTGTSLYYAVHEKYRSTDRPNVTQGQIARNLETEHLRRVPVLGGARCDIQARAHMF